MIDEKKLHELCEFGIKRGVDGGATQIEIHAQIVNELESTVELGQVNSVNRKDGTEIAIRLYIGKKMGSTFTNIPSEEAIGEAVDMALGAARVATEDPDFVGLSKPATYPEIEGLWNDEAAKAEAERVVTDLTKAVAGSVEKDPQLVPAMAMVGTVVYRNVYMNNNGVDTSERGTIGYVVLGAVAQTESGMTPMVFSFDIRRGIDFDSEAVIDEVIKFLRLCKTPVKGKGGSLPVVMHPMAYGSIMNFTFSKAIRGDNVARGKSIIGDKIGETIASPKITIFDDGTHPRGIATSLSDDEGVPRQKTPIIENGVLRSFIWDTYWANKMGVSSTGNARRDMRQGLVEIAPTTMVIEPGTKSIDDIISEIKYGYYVHAVQGAHSSNPDSGDFSIVANPAILIENGQMVGQVHGLMISGNAFDLLEQVAEVANTPIYLQEMIAPEILFTNVNVVAREE
ncbi:MAG: TldD/PmbA family protein [Candidatus Thorarchaeota archaeon]